MAHIKFLPEDKSILVKEGITLLEAARRAKVTIRTRCGGNAGCLMCKVKIIDSKNMLPPRPNEETKLGSLIDQGYRLACQTKCTGDLTVEVPEDPLKAAVRAQLARQREEQDGI
jgi:2Fe-2S ferredoxin